MVPTFAETTTTEVFDIVVLITVTVLTTSTTTATVTEVSVETFILAACRNPTLLGNGYYPDVKREFDFVPIGTDYIPQRCCSRCWATSNCLLWAWTGLSGKGGDACSSVVRKTAMAPAPPALQGICPLGRNPPPNIVITDLPNQGGFFAAGPCDTAGIPFA
ncbi:hypothetical protein W97_03865 [Coniosporium apollinis CBS 100218]|uniref:Apple domain-containing protein n=1 Tax=Coniosporium apollinis (strain CBS 100218) TaxID=1168221 RepID=R7YRU8_CONA1|nr:uncharacterized protein W97_03865 [Coniosporium apollinis CBS 100218]EON64632.1 hypothetical protein W97_03865 [Coniosporium apollinis CBS 100218]